MEVTQVSEHQPSVIHPGTRRRSYPTHVDIQEARIVRNRRLEELVNTGHPPASHDNPNTASASNTIPTGPRAMNQRRNQATPATAPLQQQYFSRYPNSEPHPHRRGGSLGDIGFQVSEHKAQVTPRLIPPPQPHTKEDPNIKFQAVSLQDIHNNLKVSPDTRTLMMSRFYIQGPVA
ncbi:hypothetical protein N0V85_005746 [Neurospora sp. IMI 360204]|nr:hypothetical protein N0V85_005746 [Neurospora sp. IMI 360204]